MGGFYIVPLVASKQRKTTGEGMRKHISTGRPMGLDIVLRPASGGNADTVTVERIEVGPALKRSRVTELHGRPYPVQFRN
jgi:hypothetical protein